MDSESADSTKDIMNTPPHEMESAASPGKETTVALSMPPLEHEGKNDAAERHQAHSSDSTVATNATATATARTLSLNEASRSGARVATAATTAATTTTISVKDPPKSNMRLSPKRSRLSFASSTKTNDLLPHRTNRTSSSSLDEKTSSNAGGGQRRGLPSTSSSSPYTTSNTNNFVSSRRLADEVAAARFEEINKLARAETSGSLDKDEQMKIQQHGVARKPTTTTTITESTASTKSESATLSKPQFRDATSLFIDSIGKKVGQDDGQKGKEKYQAHGNHCSADDEELLVPIEMGGQGAAQKPGAIHVGQYGSAELTDLEHPTTTTSSSNHDRSPSAQVLAQPGSMHVQGIISDERLASDFDSGYLENDKSELDMPVAVAAQRTEDMRNEIAQELEKEYQHRFAVQQQQQPIATSGPITTAEVIGHYDESSDTASSTAPRSRKNIYICFAIMIIIVAVVVGVAVSSASDNNSNEESKNEEPISGITASQAPIATATNMPTTTSSSAPSQLPPSSSAPTIYIFEQTDEFWMLVELLKPALLGAPTLTEEYEFEDLASVPYLVLDWMANEDSETRRILGLPNETRLLLERYSLACMYHKLNGAQWTDDHKFMTDTSVCNWSNRPKFGAACNDDGFVNFLDLGNNDMVGLSIPDELYHLTELEFGYLYLNNIGGTISPSIGNLSKLIGFSMAGTAVGGSIPSELGLLSNTLEQFWIFEAMLTGTIPTEMGLLDALKSLYIDVNQLEGPIPSELGAVTALVEVALFSNQLTGTVPTELSRLSNLKAFDIPNTQITGNLDPIFCVAGTVNSFSILRSPCGRSSVDGVDVDVASQVVCSCCTECCYADDPSDCTVQSPPLPECANNGCITCDTNVFAVSCDVCPFVDGNGNTVNTVNMDMDMAMAMAMNVTQLCYGACSWNSSSNICEERTEFGLVYNDATRW